jgi:hypothetical protein
MREYPVGSVCEIISAMKYPELVGRELTITGGLEARDNGKYQWKGYDCDLVHKGKNIKPQHEHLRLRKFPQDVDAWCNSTIKNLLKPLPNEEIKKLAEELYEI